MSTAVMNKVAEPLNIVEYNIYLFFIFSYQFDWVQDRICSRYHAFYLNPGGKIEHGMLGQNKTSLVQNGTPGYMAKWHTLIKIYASNLLGIFRWLSVPKQLGITNFNAAFVIHMHKDLIESQTVCIDFSTINVARFKIIDGKSNIKLWK